MPETGGSDTRRARASGSLSSTRAGLRAHSITDRTSQQITTSYDKTARIWDAETGATLKILSGHVNQLLGVAFSPDGKRVVTRSEDKTARVWDAETGAQIAVLKGHGSGLRNAAFSPDGMRIVTASYDGTARIWHLFATTQVLVDHAKEVLPRCLTPQRRKEANLISLEPAVWCIEMRKWPYHTAEWRRWLAAKAVGRAIPVPAEQPLFKTNPACGGSA
jgi:WD40 repeat protein